MEQKYTKKQVQDLLYEIGAHIPLMRLGYIFDMLGEMVQDPQYADLVDLIRDVRGAWVNNGSYFAGYGDEPNCSDYK